MSARSACLLPLVLALGACSLAPTYQRPETAAAPPEFRESHDWKFAQPADTAPRGPWWEQFNDPGLNVLEVKVSSANQDIKAALARLQQARAAARSSRADYMPTVTANASAMPGRVSANKPFFSSAANPEYRDNVLGADVSYELDVWGRVRNEVAASNALAAASAADLGVLDLSSHAELATDYFALRGADANLRLLNDTVTAYQKALTLTQNLHSGGAASAADVAQAQLQLQNAMTQAADTQLQRSQLEHAIAVLVGESPSTFTLAPVDDFKAMPPAVALGLPSSLLERRPDIASAERRAAAANAQIGVARVAFFPTFSLSAAAGFESTSAANWLSAPSRFWSAGPSAALTLFDGGRRRALTDQARGAYDEAAADYRQSVLVAWQEVEDNLVALRELEQEDQSETAANTAAQQALIQANYRYKGGIASYLEVVVAATTIEVRRMSASVLLVKALGGGWQPDKQDAPALSSAKGSQP